MAALHPPGSGVKAQVCSLVELLVTTLYQAYAVFYLPPEGSPRPGEGGLSCGLLFSTLENTTSRIPAGTSNTVTQQEQHKETISRLLFSSHHK